VRFAPDLHGGKAAVFRHPGCGAKFLNFALPRGLIRPSLALSLCATCAVEERVKLRTNAKWLYVAALIFGALGISNMIFERVQELELSIPLDRGVMQGNVAVLGVSLISLLAAYAVRSLEVSAANPRI
jgi:hypothetical protein